MQKSLSQRRCRCRRMSTALSYLEQPPSAGRGVHFGRICFAIIPGRPMWKLLERHLIDTNHEAPLLLSISFV